MTLVITWEHVGVMAAVLTVLGMFIGWLIKYFGEVQASARAELLKAIEEKNADQDKARLSLREALNDKSVQQYKDQAEIKKSLEAAWVKIDRFSTNGMMREDFERHRQERVESDLRLRQEFKEDIERLGSRVEAAIKELGNRFDLFLKLKNGGN